MHHSIRFPIRVLLCVSVLTASSSLCSHAIAQSLDASAFRAVALENTSAPETLNGEVFSSFTYPAINNHGEVAHIASLTGGGVTFPYNIGIWAESGSTLGLVQRGGDAAPGYPGGTFTNYRDPHISTYSAGGAVFMNNVAGTGYSSGNDTGIWRTNSTTIDLLVSEQDVAPGMAGPMYFNDFARLRVNAAGDIAFRAFVGNSPAATIKYSEGLWAQQGAALVPLALKDDPVPDTLLSLTFNAFNLTGLNNSGQAAFHSNLSGSLTANQGVFAGAPGSLRAVGIAGDQSPGLAPGVTFSSFIDGPAINDAGQTAFVSSVTGPGITGSNSTVLWTEGQGTLQQAARAGELAPGTAQTFSNFDKPVINSSGDIAFLGYLPSSQGIWTHGASGLELVVLEGDQAPGAAAGWSFVDMEAPAINAKGIVAFRAVISDGSSYSTGLWAQGTDGDLLSIIKTGEMFDVDDDPVGVDLREVSSVGLISASGGEDGMPLQFNDLNQLVIQVGFTDGTSGVFVASVPEPTSLALLLPGVALLMRRRRG